MASFIFFDAHKAATGFLFLSSFLYQGHWNKQLHSVHPSTPFLVGELSLLPNFQKEGLDRIQSFRGGCWEKEGELFQWWVLQFLHKNKLKFIIFNNVKKFHKQKFFFSVRTNNLNWETLTKNLVILLKGGKELMMKFFDIMGVHWKICFLRGFHKKPVYIAGNYLKSRPVQFADLT